MSLSAKHVFSLLCSFTSPFNICRQVWSASATGEARLHLEVADGFLSIKLKFILWNNDGWRIDSSVMTDKTIYPICHLHPVQCAQSAWIRGGIMIWICFLAAGSAQYLIHQIGGVTRIFFLYFDRFTYILYLLFLYLPWWFPVWWCVLSMVLKWLWHDIIRAAHHPANLWFNDEEDTFPTVGLSPTYDTVAVDVIPGCALLTFCVFSQFWTWPQGSYSIWVSP